MRHGSRAEAEDNLRCSCIDREIGSLVCCSECLAGWPVSSQGFSYLCFKSTCRILRLQTCVIESGFMCVLGPELRSSFLCWTLSPEPYPHPPGFFSVSLLFVCLLAFEREGLIKRRLVSDLSLWFLLLYYIPQVIRPAGFQTILLSPLPYFSRSAEITDVCYHITFPKHLIYACVALEYTECMAESRRGAFEPFTAGL